jgi:hypothetical protein
LTLIIFISCQSNTAEKVEFDNFEKSISHFNNFYVIGDTLSSDEDWDTKSYIDTSYLNIFQLIDTTFHTEYKPKTLNGYNCLFLGQYKKDNTTLLLTNSIRTEAGDGNPILTATTFSTNGKLIDILRTDLERIHDPYYQPTTFVSISKDFEIIVTQMEKHYIEGKDKLILTDSTSVIQKYRIDKDSHFILVK